MDSFNWMICEMLSVEALRERLNGPQKVEPEAPTRPSPVRRTLASSLVRLGLRLDPAVGEGLGRHDPALGEGASGLSFSLAQTEGRG